MWALSLQEVTQGARNHIARTAVFAFNLVKRDRWIETQAKAVATGARVLDVGAGSCPYRALFAHCDYRTQDFQQLPGVQLRDGSYGTIDYVSDATAIPVSDGSFDAVICAEMLEHVPDPASVVREIGRVLRPGGTLILTAPLGSGIHQEPYHYYGGFTPYWYKHFLREAGFSDIQIEANGGFFRHYGQESLRYLQLSAPGRLPPVAAMLWAPLWITLIPVMGVLLPFLGPILDRYDRERRFTVGYFVRAVKQGSGRVDGDPMG